jgi:hypothetical protein
MEKVLREKLKQRKKQMATNKEYLEKVLTEQEQTYVRQFADNDRMVEAVKKAQTAIIYQNGVINKGFDHNPMNNIAFSFVNSTVPKSDSEIANGLRAMWEGVASLDASFQVIEMFKSPEKVGEKDINSV